MAFQKRIRILIVILMLITLAQAGKDKQGKDKQGSRKDKKGKIKSPKYCAKPVPYCSRKAMPDLAPRDIIEDACLPWNDGANKDAKVLESPNGIYAYSYGYSSKKDESKIFVRQCTGEKGCLEISTEKIPCIRRSHVIFGEEVKPHKWPWMVFIEPTFCGGTVLSSRYILTAAHCVTWRIFDKNVKLKSITIHTGRHDLSKDEFITEQTKTVKDSNIIVHPKYFNSHYNNDIALLVLDTPLRFDKWTKPISLPIKIKIDEKLCRVIGWGKTEKGSTSDVLLEIKIKKQRCKLPREDRKKVRPDTMFCAHKSGRDSCKGDSGGPYMCKKNGKWVQFGIVSWGPNILKHGCGNYSGVYTKVSEYVDWIQDVTGQWGRWTGYTGCSVSCGGGFKSRVRLCNDPLPIGRGICKGFVGDKRIDPTTKAFIDVDWKQCNTKKC